MIILIRHCKPNIDYSPCDYREAARREGELSALEYSIWLQKLLGVDYDR